MEKRVHAVEFVSYEELSKPTAKVKEGKEELWDRKKFEEIKKNEDKQKELSDTSEFELYNGRILERSRRRRRRTKKENEEKELEMESKEEEKT